MRAAKAGRDVAAFVQSVSAKFGRQAGAKHSDEGAVTLLDHGAPIEHPWPRSFWFTTEVFVAGAPPVELAATVERHLGRPPGEHVVLDFHRDPDGRRAAYAALGYVEAWITDLLAKDLGPPRSIPAGPGVIRQPASVADWQAIAALYPDRTTPFRSLAAAGIHDHLVEQAGRVVAHAQLVTTAGEIAYVAEMITAPEQRQQGHCRRLLGHLEAEAERLGGRRMILMPSLMAARLGLYQRQGYQSSVPVRVLIPASAAGA